MKQVAVIPGSFDPITTGHLSLVLRAASVFDTVILLVCRNFDKEYLFSDSERVEIARAALNGVPNASVEYHGSWLYEYLLAHPNAVLVKGVRGEEDLEYEKKMAQFNFEKSKTETLFFVSSDENADISSSAVRDLLAKNGDWKKFVPQNAQKIVEKFYAEK